MAIQAKMADGRILQFPDGTDHAIIESTVQRLIAESAPPVERPSFGSPMGDDFGASIMEAAGAPKPERKVYTGSVFDTQPFNPPAQRFDAAEAGRLSNRAYAEESVRAPRRVQSMRATPEDQLDRSIPRAGLDTAIGLMQGAAGLPKSVADNILGGDNPVSQFYESAIQAGERSKSPYLRSEQAVRDALLKNVEKNQGELAATRATFNSMFSPAGADVIAQGAGSMLPTVGMSLIGLGAKSLAATNMLATAGESAQSTARELANMSPEDWSKSQVYQNLRESGLSHSDAAKMLAPLYAIPSQMVGGLAGFVSGSTGLESALVGKGIKSGIAGRAQRAGSEILGEQLETLAPGLAKNVTQNLLDDKTELLSGLGRASVETAFGSLPGAAIAAASKGPSEPQKTAEQMARERGFLVPSEQKKPEPPASRQMKELVDVVTRPPSTPVPAATTPPQGLTPAQEAAEKRRAEQRMVAELEGETEGEVAEKTPEQKLQEDMAARRESNFGMGPIQEAVAAEEQAAREKAAGVAKPTEFTYTQAGSGSTHLKFSDGDTTFQLTNAGGKPQLVVNDPNSSGPVVFYAEGKAFDPRSNVYGSEQLASMFPNLSPAVIGSLQGWLSSGKVSQEQGQKVADALNAGTNKTARVSEDDLISEAPPESLLSDEDAKALAEMGEAPSAAEEMAGAPAPMLAEVESEIGKLTEDQAAAVAEREKMEKRTAGTSLMQVLKGTLNDGELSELGGRARKVGKNQFLNLKASKGKTGSSMEDMVDSGKLDIFLPFNMRQGQPDYNNGDAAEYIREKLRNNQFYTYETEIAVQQINQDIESIERRIQQLLSDEDINKELQYAANEQREIDQAAQEPAAEVADGAAEQRKTKSADDELEKRKAQLDREEELNQREARLLEERKRLEKERLKLEEPTKESVADQEERKAKAAEKDEREQIRKESEAGAGQFKLKVEDGRRDTTGDLLDQPPAPAPAPEPATVEISTAEERTTALAKFKKTISSLIPPFRARGGDGSVRVIKPTKLSAPVMKEFLKLASDAIDLGLPPAVLGNVQAAGSTRMGSVASMTSSGWLMTGSQWSTSSPALKLLGFIHELGHAVDRTGGSISDSANWAKAHNELESWYTNSSDKATHPLAYPFAPQFRGKLRPKSESFAQAFGYYFTSPVDLQKNAPEAYSQIQSIIERIQDGSQKARAAGTTETGTAGIQVQPTRATTGAKVQPGAGQQRIDVSKTARLGDRGAGEVTSTPAFKRWFDDSKVVGADGKPMVAYHKTNADIKAFDKDKIGSSDYGYAGTGFYFLPFPLQGDTYGNTTMPVFLSLQNPFVIDDSNWRSEESPYRWIAANAERLGSLKKASEAWTEMMKSKGFDGFMDKTGKGDGEIVAFEPNQIKSAIGNNGNFDPDIVDIDMIQDAEQTGTPAFKNWFSSSEVVTPEGKPLRMYTGTSKDTDFTKFKIPRNGAWFTDSPVSASEYAVENDSRGFEWEGGRPVEVNTASRVMPVYLRIEKPYTLTEQERDTLFKADNYKRAQGIIFDGARAKGFDGVDFGDGIWVVIGSANQIKSAIGNAGTFDPKSPSILKDIVPYSVSAEEKKRSPSLKRALDKLNRDRDAGKISDERFINEVDWALKQAENARLYKEVSPRVRGADFIRQRLLEAKRKGDLSEEAVDLAEWFIQNNAQLVDGLGVSVKSSKADGVGGTYSSFNRVMSLVKRGGNTETIVHEILHHLERMMPEKVQQAIRTAWAKQLAAAQKKAKTPAEKLYFKALMNAHYGNDNIDFIQTEQGEESVLMNKARGNMLYGAPGSRSSMKLAETLLKMGITPISNYQYFNPSEFWAVNGSGIVKGRFDAVRGGVLSRLKNWLKELGSKIASVFGFNTKAPIIKALNSLAKADGVFITDEMLSTAPEYASIGQNIFGQRPLVSWTAPTESKADDVTYYLQNKQIDMKRVVDNITESIGAIEDRWNPYLMEELFHGRSAKQTRDFMKNELRPLLQEMKRMNVSTEELEEYLHNRHAQERNEQVATVNPTMPDGGSGIDTADAQAYLNALTPEQQQKYSDLADMVDTITRSTRQLMVDSGLESQETINQWEKTYGSYIPLNREDVDYSSSQGTSAGQGYSVRGSASRRATGSTKQVVDILANIAMQRERTIVRAEKNRVATALYGLATKNPNPKFWLAVNPDSKKNIGDVQNELVNMGMTLQDAEGLMKEPSQKVVDPKTGLVMNRVNPILRGADNVLAVRVNGKDRYVFFNQNNERASRMVTALKGLDADQLGFIMSNMAKVTRYFASINTQYNPIFGIINFKRDIQSGLLQLSTTEIAGKGTEVLNNVFPAIAGIYKDLRAERAGKVGRGQWSRLWDDFQQEGGQTGFRDQFSRSEERAKALEVELKKMSEGRVMRGGRALFDWLSDYNETLENAVRLSAYKVALDQGLSKEKAASLAKNLTVNFNRKGQIATQGSAMYAFLNAAIQGTTRLAQTMRGPLGKTIFLGGATLGSLQAIGLMMAGFGDDEPPEFIKNKNFIIPLMNGKYLSFPMPLGYNVIPGTFRILTEGAIAAYNGKPLKAAERVTDIAGLWMDAFNPVGNAGWSVQTIAPTIVDPIVALAENKDWTGKPIAKKDFNSLDPTPGYTRAKESASKVGEWLSEALNTASGGTKYTPGVISPTPDQIDYLIGQATGGVGRELLKTEQSIRSTVTGEELPSHKIPLVGRFYGDTKGSSSVANKFYENLLELNKHENEIKGRAKNGENVQEYLRDNPEARLFQSANTVERNVQQLRKLRNDLVEKEAPKERIKAIEANITKQMGTLNDLVEKAEAKRK